MEDMTLWWAKLRPGGLMAGHDYISAAQSQEEGQDWSVCSDGTVNNGAVKGAVNEFVIEHGLHLAVL